MATTRTLDIIVKARDEASRTLTGIGKALNDMRTRVNSIVSSFFTMRNVIVGALAGLGVGRLASEFIAAATEVEGYRVRLRILTGDMQKGNELFAAAADYASKVAFEYRDIMGATTQLRGVIKGSNEEVVKWLKITGDVAAATGLDIRTTTEQITRMYAAGASSADLFRQRGVLSMLGFQQGVSYSAEQTRKILEETWTKAGSAINGAAADLANTWDGLMSMIADKWFQVKTAVMDAGLFNYLKAWLKWFVNTINSEITNDRLSEWAKSTGEVIIGVIEKIVRAASYVGTAFQGWGVILGIAGKVLAWFSGLLADAAEELGTLARYLLGLLEKFAEFQRDVAKIMPKVIADTMVENAIKIEGSIKQWRIELEEGDQQIAAFKAGIAELKEDADKLLNSFAGQIPIHERIKDILQEVREIAAGFEKEEGRGSGGIGEQDEKKLAKRSEILKAAFSRFKADLDLEQALLKVQYEQRIIGLNAYYEERSRILEERTKAEIELQKKLLASDEVAADPNRVIQTKTRIYELEKKLMTDLIALEQERSSKILEQAENQKEVDRIINSIKDRTASFGKTDLAETFNKELRELDTRHQEELERLRKLRADETAINDAYRAQELEKETLLVDQRRRLNELLLQQASTTFGQMEQLFGDLYELSGKKTKEFFYLQKAASIAMTIIQTIESAQKAYNAMSGIPYVGPALGVAAAAVAVAAGMARVAQIRSQTLAEGGEVQGHSPHKKADNISARLTAGEFVQPVSTVEYYGKEIMEGLRRRLIPKDIFSGLVLPKIGAARASAAYAAGGVVGDNSGSAAARERSSRQQKERPININNIVDPSLMGQYLASTPGERQLINVISRNAFAVKGVLFSDG